MPVPKHPPVPVPVAVTPFDSLSPVTYYTVARKAQHAPTADIAHELGTSHRSVAKNISRAIHRLVSVGALPPGSYTNEIIALYLKVHALDLFSPVPQGPFEIRNEGVRSIIEGLPYWMAHHRQVLRLPNLDNVDLNNMVLTGADFSYTTLTGVGFTQTKLTRANLRHADLTRANLRHADLTGADLTGAIATGTDFGGAHGATDESLKQQLAMWSAETIWPSYEKAGEGR